jgi:SAM-dependent methyltransferase
LTLNYPKRGTVFLNHKGRLALFHSASNHKKYWEDYWSGKHVETLMTLAKSGRLQEFEIYGLKYLNKTDRILEAGCGPAHMVYGLVQSGYKNTIGIDYEQRVVAWVNEKYPNLAVTENNVLSLSFRDAEFDIYLSFGLVEHFEDGCDSVLREAARVTRDDGLVMISVPYLNPARKGFLEHHVVQSPPTNEGLSFHQFYFGIEDFTATLANNGLQVIDAIPYGCEAFLIREHRTFAKIWKSFWMRGILKKKLREIFYHAPRSFRMRYGHMCMFICRKVH